MLLSALLPLLVGVAGGSRALMLKWSPLQLFNPIISLSLMSGNRDILSWLVTATSLAILLNVRAMFVGVREVLDASRQRRQRAS